jgi:hypothetical protein
MHPDPRVRKRGRDKDGKTLVLTKLVVFSFQVLKEKAKTIVESSVFITGRYGCERFS